MCLNVNCHDDKMNYWWVHIHRMLQSSTQQTTLVLLFQRGSRFPRKSQTPYDHIWHGGFAIYWVCDSLLQHDCDIVTKSENNPNNSRNDSKPVKLTQIHALVHISAYIWLDKKINQFLIIMLCKLKKLLKLTMDDPSIRAS